MIRITEGTRQNPSTLTCECGEKVYMAIHHDFIEGGCICGKHIVYQCREQGCGIAVLNLKMVVDFYVRIKYIQ
jgi:hypothetical protein